MRRNDATFAGASSLLAREAGIVSPISLAARLDHRAYLQQRRTLLICENGLLSPRSPCTAFGQGADDMTAPEERPKASHAARVGGGDDVIPDTASGSRYRSAQLHEHLRYCTLRKGVGGEAGSVAMEAHLLFCFHVL